MRSASASQVRPTERRQPVPTVWISNTSTGTAVSNTMSGRRDRMRERETLPVVVRSEADLHRVETLPNATERPHRPVRLRPQPVPTVWIS